jgi:hypothetical protein
VVVLVAGEAAAQTLGGRWALGPNACDGEAFMRMETPLLVDRMSVRWFNADCTVVSSYRVKDIWYLQGRCSVEGRTSTIPIMLDLRGDSLRVGSHRESVFEMPRRPAKGPGSYPLPSISARRWAKLHFIGLTLK